jgi:hypothetical protein
LLTEKRIQKIREFGGEIVFSSTAKPWHLERFGFKKITDETDGCSIMMLVLK